jgi:predicted RNase H-like nuclease (RuvC/YqgF family)
METQEQKKKDTNKIYFLIAVIVALLGLNAYLFFQKNKSDNRVVTVSDERTALQTELEKLETELEQANNTGAQLSEELKAKDEELRAKIAQLRQALNKGQLTAGELSKAREDVKQLKYFVTKYTTDIDELQQKNAALTVERDSLKSTVNTVSKFAEDLSKQNDSLNNKVKAGAALKASNIQIIPLRVKSSGKETDVSKASSTQKIRIAFTINTNPIANKGMHDIYVRVMDPAGNLIIGEGGMFMANNQELQYTYKTAIEFSGEAKSFNLDWTNRNAFEPGNYTVLLYADGATMGRGGFTLR